MKNLKRVLSLALALVMLLGMLVVAGAAGETTGVTVASQLSDWNTVQQKEAVSMMVDLGVIKGYDDGTFKPTGKITRAEWSSLVYKVQEGLNSGELAGGVTFSDVPATAWYGGYVSFLVENGTIAGQGDNTFNPNGDISVIGAAKTLLVSLGYIANDPERGYEGDGWEGRVYQDARTKGLFTGLTETNRRAAITREDAAQMIVNALNATLVEPVYERDMGVKYINRYNNLDDTLGYKTFQVIQAQAKVQNVKDGTTTLDGGITSNGKTVSVVAGETVPATPDQVGLSVSFYVKAPGAELVEGKLNKAYSNATVVSSTSTNVPASKLLTYTGVIDWNGANTFTKGQKGYIGVEVETSATVTSNGGAAASQTVADLTDTKLGEVAEFYDTTGNGKADLIRIYNYKLATVGKAGVKVETSKDGKTTTVTIAGVQDLSKVNVANVKYPSDLKAGDVVLYYTDSTNGTFVVEKAESFTGTVTSVNVTNKIAVIGGKQYVKSGITANNLIGDVADFNTWSSTAEHTFYTDKGGNIVLATTEKVEQDKSVVVLISTGWKDGAQGTDLDGGNAAYAQAKLMSLDGTISAVVPVYQIDSKALVADAENSITELKKTDVTDDAGKALCNKFYTATVDEDGYYTLTTVADTETITNKSITAKSDFDGDDGATTSPANSKTVFLVGVKNAKNAYDYKAAITGFRSLPAMKAVDGTAVVENGVAKYVFLQAGGYADAAASELVYVADKTQNKVLGQTAVFQMSVITADGETVSVTMNETAAKTVDAEGFYNVTTRNDAGVITGIKDADSLTVSDKELVSIGREIIAYTGDSGKTESCEYDADTSFVLVDEDGKASVIDPDNFSTPEGATDKVNIVTVGDTTLADVVFVIRTVTE